MNLKLKDFSKLSFRTLDGYPVKIKKVIYCSNNSKLAYLNVEMNIQNRTYSSYIPSMFCSDINWTNKELVLLLGKHELEKSDPIVKKAKEFKKYELKLVSFYKTLSYLNTFTSKPVEALEPINGQIISSVVSKNNNTTLC